MKTLYLIDGHAQFFRAFHAIRTPMTSPVTQEPTNMTFGFTGMLLKLLRGQGAIGGPPDYVAVAIDVSDDRGTFRSQLYPEYKANRPPPPEDLGQQIDRCLKLLELARVPVIGAGEFEADDVIATIVTRLRDQHPELRIRIVSKDKDLKQLLDNEKVELFDIHTDKVINEAALMEAQGIRPDQVLDMLTLMGDTADNIPGVPGIGEKTACQLIQKYGSLEALLQDAEQIKGKRGENIRASVKTIPLSRSLVTLRHDVDLAFDLESARVENLDLEKLLPAFRELGLNRAERELKDLTSQASHSETDARPQPDSHANEPENLFTQAFNTPKREAAGEYTCITTPEELAALVKTLSCAKRIAVDTETTSIHPTRASLCGLSFSIATGAGWYIPTRSPDPTTHMDEQTVLAALKSILENPAIAKIGHNLKYDIIVLARAGISLQGLTAPGGCDTMIASFLADGSRTSHAMDALAQALLGRTNLSIKDLIGTGKNQRTFDSVPLDDAAPYAAEDTDVTLQLAEYFEPQLKAMELESLARDVEYPLVEVLAALESTGILLDPDELDQQRTRLQKRIDELHTQIADQAMETCGRSFNPGSPKQLSGILFNDPDAAEPGLGIKPIKKTKTGYSTDTEVLEKLALDPTVTSQIPALIIENRQLTKLVSTYLVALKEAIHPDTGRVHASFHQTIAATGRLSSSDPNLQNIPIRTTIGREIRKAFIAPPDRVLIVADYSQIELRILAHLSRDEALIKAFREGQDIHTAVAAQIHDIPVDQVTREQRSGAKMVNFGIVYGITPYGLASRLSISNSQAGTIIDDYKLKYPGINTFLQECVEHAKKFGYVKTILGRRRPITDLDSRNPQRRALAERIAINSVVQGSAADLIKLAMLDLHKALSPYAEHWRDGQPAIPDVFMLLQIHDELVFESPEQHAEKVKELIVNQMEAAMALDVPLVVDASIGKNWYEGK